MPDPTTQDKVTKLTSRIEVNDAALATELKNVKEDPTAGMPEAMVLRTGRPIIPIKQNQPVPDAGAGSQVWRDRLANAAALNSLIPSIGRIGLQHHPLYDWAGTGWFVEKDIVVTSRQVAELFAVNDGNGWKFRTGLAGKAMEAFIDMHAEEEGAGPLVFRITRLLYVEQDPGPDLAFLAVEQTNGMAQPPWPLESAPPTAELDVALIGYPARDSRVSDIELLNEVFGDIYNKKMLAPGRVLNTFADRIIHDCSALGNWSGAVLANTQTGKVIGLHAGGRMLEYNYAIPAAAIENALYRAKNSVARTEVETAAVINPINNTPIIDISKNIVQFSSFQQGLDKASSIAVLVRDKKRKMPVCTGWLLTESLVVIPDYSINAFSSRALFECYFVSAKDEITAIEARVVHYHKRKPNGPLEETEPALLRLKKPAAEFTTTLNMGSMQEISSLYLLHFPGGKLPLQLSISPIQKKGERILEYSAFTKGGSGGAPLLSYNGSVIGMHFASRENLKIGLTLRAIVADLQKSKFWNEIAKVHNLPVIKKASEIKKEKAKVDREAKLREKLLFQYALRWSIDPKKLSAPQKKLLSEYVVDTQNKSKWIMEEDERIQLIKKMGTLRKLREARGKTRISDEGQKVIDAILKGAPYKLDKIEDNALPYWLQAIAWFENVVPKLPSRQAVSAELQRRKLKSRLSRSAGPDFRGRDVELRDLKAWYKNADAGAMVISGIGGIGKSALVSKFAMELGEKAIIFWLDFDRADLAPDKAMSVLRILTGQLSYQVNDYTPPTLTPKNWESAAEEFGIRMKQYTSPQKSALLVLDGFEVAQHSKKYNQIWPLLEWLLQKAPALKVIVSGRAPVRELKLNGKNSQPMPLTGLEPAAARQWLLKHNIRSEAAIKRTTELSKGSPLLLKLAVRHMEEGGKISELPANLPRVMYEGFLFQRIYNRVIDHRLRDVVKDILVLRVISPQIIKDVLHDNIPAKMTPDAVFEGILRELSLVPEAGFAGENAGNELSAVMVNVRPEVRAASLKLLEFQNEKRVREIDQRAILFYKRKRKATDAEKIELVYHYLRMGKVAEAQKLWRQDYIKSLEDNLEDIPEKYPAAKEWLSGKAGNAPLVMDVADWETDAYNRIKELRTRGHLGGIAGILAERKERSDNSRLLIYDAWNLWMEGNAKEALQKLNHPADAPLIHYERHMIAAKINYQKGDIEQCGEILATLRNFNLTGQRRILKPVNLITIASQIMFLVSESLKKEIALLEFLHNNPHSAIFDIANDGLSDFILPQLQALPSSQKKPDKILRIPANPKTKETFLRQLGWERNKQSADFDMWQKRLGTNAFKQSSVNALIFERVSQFLKHSKNEKEARMAGEIAMLSWERWHLALTGYWLRNVINVSDSETGNNVSTAFSVAPAFSSFRGHAFKPDRRTHRLPAFASIDKYVEYMMKTFLRKFSSAPITVNRAATELAIRYIELLPNKSKRLIEYRKRLASSTSLSIDELLSMEDPSIRTVLFMIMMPNPVEVAGNEVLGFPYIFANENYLTQKRFS